MRNMPSVFSVSVRNIVEFILRRGDIDSAAVSASSDMTLGTKIHRRLQKNESEKGDYSPEVRLFGLFEFDDITIRVQGIADGVLRTADGVIIDEIKSTSYPLDAIDDEFSFLHRAQADFYAYFLCVNENLEKITTRITYCNIDSGELRYIYKERTAVELHEFTLAVAAEYSKWALWKVNAAALRDETAASMPFPFDDFRPGQREAAAYVYRAIKESSTLFAQAPTGIGKTVSALFPSIKALGEGLCGKLFYLTAKNMTRSVAENALMLMRQKGLIIRSVTITAKEKVCAYGKQCTPGKCPYAAGHYDRINDAIYDIITNETVITNEILMSYAEKHNVCPFEFTLDVSEWCDVVVCDYNYAFDPRASLRRYFEQGGDYVLLCDEAHNLADRGREMFSAFVSKKAVLEAVKALKISAPRCVKALKAMNKILLEYRKRVADAPDGENYVTEKPEELYRKTFAFCEIFSAFLSEEGHEDAKNAVIELFFDCLAFISVYEDDGDEYIRYVSCAGGDTIVRLFCADPSRLISKTCDKCRSVVFFSATLLPKDYYLKMLGGKTADRKNGAEPKFLRLKSPFPRENLMVSIYSAVSTRYRHREKSLDALSELIRSAAAKTGNYIAFFPSFAYMTQVADVFTEKYPDISVAIQRTDMTEDERADFLSLFRENPEKTLVGFAVMGGVFSEGVDLVGSRLSGVVIAGTGLPQLCFERDLIRGHFEKTLGKGFLYAYEYPGFNRVLQAAGRVIRSETDRGIVILADDRWSQEEYRALFPPEWFGDGFEFVFTKEKMEEKIARFMLS